MRMIIREMEARDTGLSLGEFRNMIMKAQNHVENMPGAAMGGELDKLCPLKHSFGKDVYVREIFVPAGHIIITKIHKFNHPFFVMKGRVSILTEEGVKHITAPYHGMTKAGTKRAVFHHEDTIWITVHGTNKTDLKEIEDEIISKDFEGFEDFINKDVIEGG